MRYLIDSNILISAIAAEAPDHEASMSFLRTAAEGPLPWCITWVNVYEFLRVITHRGVFRSPLRWETASARIRHLLTCPAVELLQESPRHMEIFEEVAGHAGGASGNFIHDCHIAALMLEHDVRTIVTRDSHFRRFGLFRVLSPGDASEELYRSSYR